MSDGRQSHARAAAGAFDAYHRWLGIPPAEQPPNHYRLLGIAAFEPDLDVIEEAADRQMSHVRSHQGGPHSAESQRLLNELAAAKLCLMDSARREMYDRVVTSLAPLGTVAPTNAPGSAAMTAPQAAVTFPAASAAAVPFVRATTTIAAPTVLAPAPLAPQPLVPQPLRRAMYVARPQSSQEADRESVATRRWLAEHRAKTAFYRMLGRSIWSIMATVSVALIGIVAYLQWETNSRESPQLDAKTRERPVREAVDGRISDADEPQSAPPLPNGGATDGEASRPASVIAASADNRSARPKSAEIVRFPVRIPTPHPAAKWPAVKRSSKSATPLPGAQPRSETAGPALNSIKATLLSPSSDAAWKVAAIHSLVELSRSGRLSRGTSLPNGEEEHDGGELRQAIEIATIALNDPDHYVRVAAVEFIGQLHEAAGIAGDMLADHCRREKNATGKRVAVQAMRGLRTDSVKAVDVLTEIVSGGPGRMQLKSNKYPNDLRKDALDALGSIGVPAKKAAPVVLRMMEAAARRVDLFDDVFCQCAECLGEIGGDNSAVEKALKRHARGHGLTVTSASGAGRWKSQIEKCRLAAEKAVEKIENEREIRSAD